LRNRRVTIYDPLTRPENRSTRKAVENSLEYPAQGVPKRSYKPLEDRVTNNCQNDLLVQWLMELYINCEQNAAQLRKGEFPKVVLDRVEANRKKAAELQWGAQDPLPQLV